MIALQKILARVGLRTPRNPARLRVDQVGVWDEMFRHAAFGIGVIEASSDRIFFANPALARMVGRTPAEMIGLPLTELSPVPERDRLARFSSKTQLEDQVTAETVLVHRDGSLLPVEMRATPVRDGAGRDIYLITSVYDISERRRVEAERDETRRQADESLALLDTILSQSPIAFGYIDSGYRYRLMNQALSDLVGKTPAECIGRTVEEVAPYRWKLHGGLYRRMLEDGVPSVNVEERGTWPGRPGSEMVWLNSRYPVRVGGRIIGVGIFIVDVTHQRQIEAQLRQALKMEAIGNLTGGIAHDFNNLLAVIVGNLDIAGTMIAKGSEAAPLVESAFGAAQRGAELTRRLLAYARRQPLRPEAVQPDALLRDLCQMLGRTLGTDIEITLVLAPDTWPVLVDPAQLEAALLNLCTNARDAMPKGGRLLLSTSNVQIDGSGQLDLAAGDYAVIEVADTGCGMPPEVASQVFEPFFTTKALGKGTGLGLSMVFGFVKQSGGHVQLDTAPDRGATFRLYLPRALAVTVPQPPAPAVATARGGETILVVEDNAPLRALVSRQLESLGYRVLAAERAEEALELLSGETADLLFADVILPGGTDGIALAERVQAAWPKTRILLTTGYPDLRFPGHAGPGAAPRLLVKPYRTAALAAAVRAALDSPAP